ncbi:flagellar biosynthetic protein FliR [Thermodesulfobacteriota bacterium]
MEFFGFSLNDFILVLLIFFRVAGIIFTAPVFGSLNVPVQAKAGLSILLTFIIAPNYHANQIFNTEVISLTLLLIREVGIGFLIGFIARLIFSAVQLGGQLIGLQMGLGIVSVMDPQTQQQVSIIAQFMYLVAILLFLAFDGHLWFIKAIFTSFNTIEIGTFYVSGKVIGLTIKMVAEMFVLGVKVAAPIMALVLCFDTLLGIFARTVPQMNVLILGFPLKIGVGLLGLGMILPYFAFIMQKYFIKLNSDLSTLLYIFK